MKPWGYEEQTFPAASLWQAKLHQNILNTFLLSYSVIQLWNFLFSNHPDDEAYHDGEDYWRVAVFSFKQNKSKSSEEFSLCSVFCLYSHCALKMNNPSLSECTLVEYSSMVELPTAFELSLYERCWSAGTMHHSLSYYTHIFPLHPCQRWMVEHTFSSARGGRGDFSCLFLFIFLFLGGGRGGEER